ncbi:MAG: PAS domain-containing protein [Gemmatimonadales bacterium]|nr:PAS domain-containing protein [Gemmatimonadales bacterium]
MFSRWLVVEESDPESRQAVFAWLVRLRWVAVLGVALVLLLAGPAFHRLPAGSSPWLWAITAGLAGYNALLALSGHPGVRPWLTGFAGQITVDCIALATLVHFAGGIDNPFLPLFVLHVVTANIVLSGRAALGVLGLAIVLVTAVVVGEGTGLLPHHCLQPAGEPCSGAALDLRSTAALGGLVLTLVASSLFTRSLTARLRAGRRRLQTTVAELTAEKQQLAETRSAIETERVRLQAIIDCMGDAVIFLDPGGRLLFSNQQARELWRTGTSPGPDDSFEALLAEVQQRPVSDGAAAFHRGGRTFEATRALVRSGSGTTLGLVLVARDITDRVLLEKRLMHDEQLSVVGKLAAAVAHEINNPIGVVVLYSQHALAALPPDNPVYPHLEIIRRNADGCRAIVEGLLKLARPHRPERRPVDLRQLCRETMDSVRPLALRAGVRISGGGHQSRVPIWTQADAGMLHQAVLNLAVNAIEAAGEGDEVSIGAYETQDRDVAAQAIEVRDTGAGITPGDLDQLFQPFFTTKAAGTGLGLSVAENIVRSHDGRIEVESAVGAGTTFRIVLPDRSRRA